MRRLVMAGSFAGFAMLCFDVSPVRAEELVVFESTGAPYRPGQVIDGAKPLTLEADWKVALIAPDGRIVRLKGPLQRVPLPKESKGNQSMEEIVSRLMKVNDTDSGSFGVMRSADSIFNMARKKQWLPDPWLVDVSQSGSYCQQEGQKTIFWRPDYSKDAMVIVRMDNGRWWDARWTAGKGKMLSPPSMPLVDGKTYEIQVSGVANDITLHIIPETVSTQAAQAAWMKEKGCKSQLMALLRSMTESAEKTPTK